MKVLFSCLAATAVFSQPSPQTIKAHFTPKQQQTERYVYVPFEVSAGVTRIDLELRYQKTDLNVVDLALMEPGSTAFGTKAFRGWSGGERSSIFVSTGDATPGYWPGPIPAGKWNVVLGLYKVGPDGVDVEVVVKTSTDAQPPVKALATRSVGRGGADAMGRKGIHMIDLCERCRSRSASARLETFDASVDVSPRSPRVISRKPANAHAVRERITRS